MHVLRFCYSLFLLVVGIWGIMKVILGVSFCMGWYMKYDKPFKHMMNK